MTLISALCGLQSPTHLFDELGSPEHHLRVTHESLTNLAPTNQVLTLPPVEHLKRRSINTDMVVVVVRKLSQWEMRIPATTKIYHKCPKYILQGLNSPLTLSIRPQMKSRVEVQTSTQLLMQSLPEHGSEPNIPI